MRLDHRNKMISMIYASRFFSRRIVARTVYVTFYTVHVAIYIFVYFLDIHSRYVNCTVSNCSNYECSTTKLYKKLAAKYHTFYYIVKQTALLATIMVVKIWALINIYGIYSSKPCNDQSYMWRTIIKCDHFI